MPLLEGRRGLVFGVANRRSIAWAIAQALAREGAELAFTFQGERIEQGVRDLAATLNSPLVVPADVTRDEDLDSVFEAVDRTWGGLDLLVHSVAFAPPRTFEQPFAATRREDFLTAMGQKNASGLVTEHADNLLSDAIDTVPDCKAAGLTQPKDVATRLKKS